jgi:predicted DNA-binding transcriptional regulator AlpA
MSVIDELRDLERRLVARIKELESAAAELLELRSVAERLGIKIDSANGRTSRGRGGRGRTRARSTRSTAKKPATTTRRATRARASTTTRRAATRSAAAGGQREGRREQVYAIVQSTPGIRVKEVADKLGLSDATSLYRVVRKLESEGKITKTGPRLTAK